jgi:predicted acylesterase/phospholipase RssA/CRP-like cAMP-binding protein
LNLDSGHSEFWHARLATHLSGLFDAADPAALLQLEADAEWVSLRGGETLFRLGDPGDAAYVVLSGRLRAVDDRDGERTLNDIGVGETVGEMALLSSDRRSATVYAVRDSLLAKLSAPAFQRLIESHPQVLQRISGLLIQRLRRKDAATQRARAPVRTIAVVPAGGGDDIGAFAQRLASALAMHGTTLLLDARCVREALGQQTALGPQSDVSSPQIVQWLNEREAVHRFVLYQADPHPSEWTERAVRQADHLLLVADADADPRPGAVERRLEAQRPQLRSARVSLALLRPAAARAPAGAGEFLAQRQVDCHYHVALDSTADFARLARCLTGAGIGLVLSGGGARGFAHLGVLRALAENGVPVDWICGTSSGAFVGALAAQGLSPAAVHARCKQHFVSLRDPTLPLVALLAGHRIRARLEQAFGAERIEDLALPFLCVSTNLSRAAQAVHERGSLLRAIRASISLPGILPPVSIERDLHVDGGLVNNMPIDLMAAKPEIGAVLAVDVSAEVEMRAPPDLAAELSGWRVLWRRINPWSAPGDVPGIMSLLTRSSLVASVYWTRERRAAEAASLYLRVPVADLRLLAFERIDEIAARGYDSTREAIAAWWARYDSQDSTTHGSPRRQGSSLRRA